MCGKRDGLAGRRGNDGSSGAKALNEREGLIAALEALRHPKALHDASLPRLGCNGSGDLERARQPKLFCQLPRSFTS